MTMLKKIKNDLELIIDSLGVENAFALMNQICQEKAQHVTESYNDKKLAAKWSKTATVIMKAKVDVSKISL